MLSGAVGQVAMAAFWLGVILLLILAAARGARLLPSLRATAQTGGELVLRGSLALDTRRRLQLVQAGPHRILVLTGGTGESLLVLPAVAASEC